MSGTPSHPKFRRRVRLVCLTCVLGVSAAAMGIIVWKRLEETRIVTWVAAVNKMGVDVDVSDDPWDPSLLGRARIWLKLPTTQVYVWGEPEARLLLRAPSGDPRPLLLHLDRHVTEATRQQLTQRFPGAEQRPEVPVPSGKGFF